jgi:hypothetical protein
VDPFASLLTPVDADAPAWQPLTPRGVAAFARAPVWRVLLVQFIFAIAVASTVGWFLRADWFPVVRKAVRRLPETGEIRSGRLNWTNASPQLLAEGRFLAIAVDLNHVGAARSPAHVQVEFGRNDVWIYSLLGYRDCVYPRDRVIGFNRPEMEPWWGAWSPPVWWIVFAVVLLGLMASWAALAALYFLPVWLMGFFANRDLNLRGSWNVAGASLMPGALFMIGAILCYGLGALDLVQLAAATCAHMVIGWVYLLLGVWCVPRLPFAAAVNKNPFVRE